MRYIVKNCPAITKIEMILTSNPPQSKVDFKCSMKNEYGVASLQNCQNCTDCPIKQVIEKCKQQSYFVKRFPDNEYSDGVVNSKLAQDILQLFELEEYKE